MDIKELVVNAMRRQVGEFFLSASEKDLDKSTIDIVIDIAEKYDLKAWIMDKVEARRQRQFMSEGTEMLWVETRDGPKDDYCILFNKDLSSYVRGKLRKLKMASL